MAVKIRSVVALFAIVLLPVSGVACTCVFDSLKDRFLRAEAVFVGGLYDFEESEKAEIQNFNEGLPVLWVKKRWKGIHKELVAIDFDFPKGSGGSTCPFFYQFEPKSDYLIFAYGKDLKVAVECSDTQMLTTTYNNVHKEISRLDSKWFRLKARVWPF